MEKFEFEIVEIPSYKAVGLKWEGSYNEIPELKRIIHHMSQRVNELVGALHPQIQLGLSFHVRPDGFLHYSAYEVCEDQAIPKDMEEITIPAMSYLITHHKKGDDIGHTYHRIYQWFKESEYQPYREPNVEYFDDLPIKHERYPSDRDLKDPHFDILIPVLKK
ncbi:MAG: GyrI-like domain-containing protein [Bacillota bacterium]